MKYIALIILFSINSIFGQTSLDPTNSQIRVKVKMFEGMCLTSFLKDCKTKHLSELDPSVLKINLEKLKLNSRGSGCFIRCIKD
jgi:hypothetical protein